MKLDRKYVITVYSQLGPKIGILEFGQKNEKIIAALHFLGHSNKMVGSKEGLKINIKGKVETTLGPCESLIHGLANEKRIRGLIIINEEKYKLIGNRIK